MQYSLLIIPIIVAVVTQIIKLSIDGIKGNVNFKFIFISYGGMPSAHSAFSVSVTTLAALSAGINSLPFAIAFVFTILVMRDAITFRNILGKQGALLNQLTKMLPNSGTNKFPHFQERIGHSFMEVFVGAIFGIILSWILYVLFSLA